MLEVNMGAGGDGVAAAYRLLDARGLHRTWMCACGSHSMAGSRSHLAVWSEPGDLDVSRRVDDILVGSGRPLDALWREDAPWFWELNA
ncbi:hypothetical protein ABZW96_25685 [Nocardia sp. NPDC004168]|uniref:hypothetical protein n=1 Tax=Nocardia sp. NPDC004168 TaxID=3154452 RepID=UPI0033A8616B